jgi:DNA polymerase IV
MVVDYLFIDMNAYFASCEQHLQPHLRGRPVAVTPVDADSTACIAASYEAKKFGIKTGTRASDARMLCPGITLVPARPKEYIRIHHQIIDAIDSVLPVTTVMSVDEMMCKLWGTHREPDVAVRVAHQVKQAIYTRVGEYLRSSIGIAPNRLLAKVAADMHKPDGLTLLTPRDIPGKLLSLQLTDFPGIGAQMEKRLHRAGVYSVEHFVTLSAKQLSEIWGSKLLGTTWWHRLRGTEVGDPPTRRQSLGHSKVLHPNERNPKDARGVVVRLVHKAAARLRDVGFCARSVSVSISYTNRDRWGDGVKIAPCQDTLTLIEVVSKLWEERAPGDPLKVGVLFADLTHERNVPRSLFEPDNKRLALAKAMDEANTAFGRYAVYFGGMHGLAEAVTTRIAFGVVPDLDLVDC